jgi:hypothetical protein
MTRQQKTQILWTAEGATRRDAAPAPARSAGGFEPLIALDVGHEYYGTGAPCDDLEFQPTPLTAARLARFGVLFRPRRAGFDLLVRGALIEETAAYIAQAQPGAEDLAAASEPPLLFVVRLREPDFVAYTELREPGGDPSPRVGTGENILSLSNRHQDESKGGAVPIDTAPRVFEALPDEGDHAPSPHARTKRETPPRLLAEGAAERAAAWAEQGAIAGQLSGRPFALLHLFLAAPTDPQGGFAQGTFPLSPAGLDPVRYRLDWTARRTFWRYVVVPRAAGARFEIVSDGAAGAFAPDAVPAGFGPGACAFVSRDPLPLRARSDGRWQLRSVGAGSYATDLPLPAPSPIQFARQAGGGGSAAGRPGELVSEIFVTL